jgi:hypothetical protein
MSIQDPKPQDDAFDDFLRGKDELSLLLQDIPQPSPSERLDSAILADAERATTRDRIPPPAAANDAILPASERVRRPSFATAWGIMFGLVAGAGITFLLLTLQSASRISRPPEGKTQPPLELRIYPSEANDLQPQDDSSAQIPLPAFKPPKPALPLPETRESSPNANGKTSPQSADKTGTPQK